MITIVHAVIETPTYLADADEAGLTAEMRIQVVTFLAYHPEAGDVMVGTGGARKFRFARPGAGKSGGYRIVFYYGGADVPLFLLTVFAKGDRANLSMAERNELKAILSKIAQRYREGVKHGQDR